MSSFICNSKQFNSIEKAVTYLALGTDFYFPYSFKSVFPELYEKRKTGIDTAANKVTEIIDTIRQLNVLCVSLQYAHHYEGVLDNEIKEQTEIVMQRLECRALTSVELYKQLNCVSYQIEIEHLKELRDLTQDEENAMFFLREIQNSLASHIVHKSPAYDKAEW